MFSLCTLYTKFMDLHSSTMIYWETKLLTMNSVVFLRAMHHNKPIIQLIYNNTCIYLGFSKAGQLHARFKQTYHRVQCISINTPSQPKLNSVTDHFQFNRSTAAHACNLTKSMNYIWDGLGCKWRDVCMAHCGRFVWPVIFNWQALLKPNGMHVLLREIYTYELYFWFVVVYCPEEDNRIHCWKLD